MGVPWPLAIAILAVLITGQIISELFSQLRCFPGPLLARFFNIWRLLDVLRGRPDQSLSQLHAVHGIAVRVGPSCISIADPSLLRTIFTFSRESQFVKGDFYKVADVAVGGQIISTNFSTRDEALHTALTRRVNKLYTLPKIIQFEGLMDATIDSFLQILNERFVAQNEPCPFQDYIHYLAWDIIAELTFSRRFGFLERGGDVENIMGLGHQAMNYLAVIGQMPFLDKILAKNPISPFGPPSLGYAAVFAANMLKARRSGEDRHDIGQPDFLDEFLKLQLEDPTITDNEILSWEMSNIVAGSDTISAVLQGLVFHLSKETHCRWMLQAELDRANLGPAPQWRDISKLPYLDAVIQESMRVHPVVWTMWERVVPSQGLDLRDGRRIPGGTTVGVNPWVVHQDQNYFGEDARAFRPERWLCAPDEDGQAYETRLRKMREGSFFFGWGKRMCGGRNVAIIEMRKVVAALYRRYDVVMVDPDRDWIPSAKWLRFHADLSVKLNPR